MKLAIASYSFHGMLGQGTIDGFGYLESMRHRYGLRSADIWNGMIPSLEEPFLKKLKNALAERELTLANLCVDGPHLWENSPAAREKNHKLALKWLKAAEYLGARTIRIDAGGRTKKFTKSQLAFVIERYREYARIANNAGFRVGPENHWGPEVDPDTMRAICEGVNHPGFGVLCHFKGTGEEKFARYAMHTHISWDVTISGLEKKLSILRTAGYTGFWSVEHHSGRNEHAEVAIQLGRVRDVLLRWDQID